MASAAEQARRDSEIRAAHASGQSVADVAARFGLSRSRVKQIVAANSPLVEPRVDGMRLAEERLKDYRDLLAEARAYTRAIPETQSAAKVGAFRLIFDALGHLTSLEQKLGYLPQDLAEFGREREFADAVLGIIVEYDVPAEARNALRDALGGDRWAAS